MSASTRRTTLLGLSAALLALPGCLPATPSADAADAVAVVGEPAPDFTLPDTTGADFTLSAHRGSTVVLEWFNPDCPFVRYAYEDGPLAKMAQTWTDQGVVWVAVNSGKPGKQGTGAERNTKARADWKMPAPVLLDESGSVGRTFEAKTTPQIVVINPEGTLVYNGALDNRPLGKGAGEVRSYAAEVLAEVTTKGTAPYPRQKPYGCSVKY